MTRSAIAPTWRLERPDVTIMVSAIEVLPTRSISTVFSAFMSSRHARATASEILVGGAPLRRRGGSGLAQLRSSGTVGSGSVSSHDRRAQARAALYNIVRTWRDISIASSAKKFVAAPKLGRGQRRARAVQEDPGRRAAAAAGRRRHSPAIRQRDKPVAAGEATALMRPARPVDDRDRHHPGDLAPAAASGGSSARLSAPMIQTKSNAGQRTLQRPRAYRRCSAMPSSPRTPVTSMRG